ncbi:MAG: sugar phosphate isomerase/epimerase family protein [Candidatus Sumerlaeota bacterium]
MQFSITIPLELPDDLSAEIPQLALAASAGLSAIDWNRDWIGDPVQYDEALSDRVGEAVARYGLRVDSVHGWAGYSLKKATEHEAHIRLNRNRIAFAGRPGARAVILHLPAIHGAPDVEAAIDDASLIIDGLRDAAEKHNVRLAIENLFDEPEQFGEAFFDALLDKYPPGFVGYCFDSGHALVNDRVHYVERYGQRLIVTHLHDNDGEYDQHRVPGQGIGDWERIARAVTASALDGPVNFEVCPEPDQPIEEFAADFRRAILQYFQA